MEGLDSNQNQFSVSLDDDLLQATNYTEPPATVATATVRSRPSDAWIGPAVLFIILLILACITAGFIYSKFRRWKAEVVSELSENGQPDLGRRPSKEEFPPSYLVVTGLPSYDQAVQFARRASLCRSNRLRGSATSTPILAPISQCSSAPEGLISEILPSEGRGFYPNPPLSPPTPRRSVGTSPLPEPVPSTSANSFNISLDSDVESKSSLVKALSVTIDVGEPLVSI
ncbi:Hypothetical protein NTJ_03083 [Nesidiocoris tenuis]|uniref:Uncharacterized protein n=1 Tax=Nesidiocoris tenuis TaxID=355587 RepID=A0ABN7AFX9_9HEMI|nr:Hypothetical protein NTJ_03083 [Nesidiocoris tenuis]